MGGRVHCTYIHCTLSASKYGMIMKTLIWTQSHIYLLYLVHIILAVRLHVQLVGISAHFHWIKDFKGIVPRIRDVKGIVHRRRFFLRDCSSNKIS